MILDLLKILSILEKNCLKIDSNGFRSVRVKNQRENKLEMKNADFHSFLETSKFPPKREKTYLVNNFDWMIVKLRMSAT